MLKLSAKAPGKILRPSVPLLLVSVASLLVAGPPTGYPSYPLTLFGITATAQDAITDGEIAQFAKSVWEIEQKRQQAYNEIKKINNGETPPINCSDADSLNGLRREVRELAVSFCEESKIIAANNGLTVSRFNQIQIAYQNDAQVKQKVDAELIRIQRESIVN